MHNLYIGEVCYLEQVVVMYFLITLYLSRGLIY